MKPQISCGFFHHKSRKQSPDLEGPLSPPLCHVWLPALRDAFGKREYLQKVFLLKLAVISCTVSPDCTWTVLLFCLPKRFQCRAKATRRAASVHSGFWRNSFCFVFLVTLGFSEQLKNNQYSNFYVMDLFCRLPSKTCEFQLLDALMLFFLW